EPVPVAGEDLQRLGCHVPQRDRRLVERGRGAGVLEHLLVGEEPEQLAAARGGRELLGRGDVPVPQLPGTLDEVARRALARLGRVGLRVVGPGALLALRVPPVLAAAEADLDPGLLQVLTGDLALVPAVLDVRAEGRRR